MKRTVLCISLSFAILLAALGSYAYFSQPKSAREVAARFSKVVEEEIPRDLRLTVYYISPAIFTRMPVSIEGLKTFSDVKKIVIESEELAEHAESLIMLDASSLQPAEEDRYIDARLYYVFERWTGQKVLEVTSRGFGDYVFVNGYPVEHTSVLYEIIDPFLTEDDYNTLYTIPAEYGLSPSR